MSLLQVPLELRQSRCALVLAGAVGQGAFDAGVLYELVRRGIRPQTVVATSSGALNGLMLAAGMARGEPRAAMSMLRQLWLEEASFPRLLRRSVSVRGIWARRGLLHAGHLLDLMRRYAPPAELPRRDFRFGCVMAPLAGRPCMVNRAPHRSFEHVAMFGAADFTQGSIERVYRAVAASAAFPLLFEPVHVDGVGPCIDGGTVNNTPLALVAGCDVVLVCSSYPPNAAPDATAGGIRLVETIADMIIHERLLRDLGHLDKLAHVIEIRPEERLPGGAFGSLLDRRLRQSFLEMGQRAARKMWERCS